MGRCHSKTSQQPALPSFPPPFLGSAKIALSSSFVAALCPGLGSGGLLPRTQFQCQCPRPCACSADVPERQAHGHPARAPRSRKALANSSQRAKPSHCISRGAGKFGRGPGNDSTEPVDQNSPNTPSKTGTLAAYNVSVTLPVGRQAASQKVALVPESTGHGCIKLARLCNGRQVAL
jgi:hypothetical protein